MGIQEITLILNAVSMLIVGISAYLLQKQIKSEHDWNKRKIAEETLTVFTSGKFMSSLDELSEKYNWYLLRKNGERYEEVIERIGINSDERRELDKQLVKIFIHLETVSIKMNHGILDEKIVQDYLFSVLTNINQKCKSFLVKAREDRNESCLYENAEYFGDKWGAECRIKK